MLSATPANSQNIVAFITGNDLNDFCMQSPIQVFGYLEGLVDGEVFEPQHYCLPEGVQIRQLKEVTCRFLQDHPESRQQPAPSLVRMSFRAAWPCP
ncbi:Rap1a/Tai family immunity protein [Mesorhizobium sp. M0848]